MTLDSIRPFVFQHVRKDSGSAETAEWPPTPQPTRATCTNTGKQPRLREYLYIFKVKIMGFNNSVTKKQLNLSNVCYVFPILVF